MSSISGLYFYRLTSGYTDKLLGSLIDVFRERGTPVICDAGSVFDGSHVSFALMHASRAILDGRSRARDPAMEVIRWMAGAHQISRALISMTPSNATENILVVLLPRDWPEENDGREPAEVLLRTAHPAVPGLEPLKNPVFGRNKALERIGIGPSEENDIKRVLEHVSSLEWD